MDEDFVKALGTNCSKTILCPILFDREEAENVGFITSYLIDNTHEFIPNSPVYCLFRVIDSMKFNYFLTEQRKKKFLVDDYDIGEYTVLLYSLKKLDGDYKLFLKGKYSEMSDEFRKKLPKESKIKVPDKYDQFQVPVVWGILDRNPLLKDWWEDNLGVSLGDEVWKAVNMEAETLNYDNL